ncbi:MAG: DUF1761 domain-containing protein [Flavobacteriales bacterium]
MFEHTNWLAVLVSALAMQALGFLVYNPKTFGTIWMKGGKIDPNSTKTGHMALIMGLSFVMTLVLGAYLSTWVHPDEHLSQFMHGAFHGFMLSIFLIVPVIIMNALYEQKGIGYILVNCGYAMAGLALQGGILFMWPAAEVAVH